MDVYFGTSKIYVYPRLGNLVKTFGSYFFTNHKDKNGNDFMYTPLQKLVVLRSL